MSYTSPEREDIRVEAETEGGVQRALHVRDESLDDIIISYEPHKAHDAMAAADGAARMKTVIEENNSESAERSLFVDLGNFIIIALTFFSLGLVYCMIAWP